MSRYKIADQFVHTKCGREPKVAVYSDKKWESNENECDVWTVFDSVHTIS